MSHTASKSVSFKDIDLEEINEDRKNGPKVSVIITTYNRSERLKEAIRSVREQIFTDWEIILVDDCSPDDTPTVVKEIKDHRIKYFRLEENHEFHCYPKNYGIEKAQGEYITFLDDDDTYREHALEILFNHINGLELDIVYGRYQVYDEGIKTLKQGHIPAVFDHEELLKRNYITTCSVIIKKAELLKVGGFDENVARLNDWHLWLRLHQNGCRFNSVQDVLSTITLHEKTVSRKYDIYTNSKGEIVTYPYFDIKDIKILPTKSCLIIETSSPEEVKRMVSIIVPVIYRPDLAKVCIDSIINYTKFQYELILVQEGDDKEVTELLKSYDVKFVQNKVPKGFAGAMNSGIGLSKGSHYCFLNSDTVAIPGWLEYMMEAFKDEEVGLVTPTYSEMPGQQSIAKYTDKKFEYVDEPLSLKGVCFLISKKAIDEIGGWDEDFGLGGGDDNDMTYRIKKGGYKLVIAREAYIYHYGSASFREEFSHDENRSKKYAVGQFAKFRKKHLTDEKPRVFIAIPDKDGVNRDELTLRLIEWSHDPEIHLNIKFYPYMSPLDHVRNFIVREFLEDYWDYLLQIDACIVPPPHCLRELLAADKDVIAPLCLTLKPDDKGLMFPIPVAMRYNKDKQYQVYYGTGVEETDVITGGMFLVKREVYEKIERPFAFTYHRDGVVEHSEDFYFSQQCQKVGYKLYTHYDLMCKHYRITDVKGINDLMLSVTSKSR